MSKCSICHQTNWPHCIKGHTAAQWKKDRESVDEQGKAWVDGNPMHNTYRDECTPDFSCCNRDLFIKDRATRLAVHNAWAAENGKRLMV